MDMPERLKILLAYDGSDLALDAVRYIGSLFPKHRAEVVIFYVETKIPRAFWHMEQGLDFRFRTPEIRAAMARRKKVVNTAIESARNILLKAGFPSKNVYTKVHIKSRGVAEDIIEETRQGYDALVMGRKGQSRIKDFVSEPLPVKLTGKITTIPLIVVGRTKDPRNILVAFDGTREITRAVESMSRLIETQGTRLLLCHCRGETQADVEISPRFFDHPMAYFLDAGFTSDQIATEIMSQRKPPFHSIIDKAKADRFGTIVIGRRRLTPFKHLTLGRVGSKIFKYADNHVVWIVQ